MPPNMATSPASPSIVSSRSPTVRKLEARAIPMQLNRNWSHMHEVVVLMHISMEFRCFATSSWNTLITS